MSRRRKRMPDDESMEVTPQIEAQARRLYEHSCAESGYASLTLPWERLSNIGRNSWRKVAYEHAGSEPSQTAARESAERSQ